MGRKWTEPEAPPVTWTVGTGSALAEYREIVVPSEHCAIALMEALVDDGWTAGCWPTGSPDQ